MATPPLACLALCSGGADLLLILNAGVTWAPETGGLTPPTPAARNQPLVCNSDPSSSFGRRGCPDGSSALDPDTGGVHLIWDWNDDLGGAKVPHAGLGHSYAPPNYDGSGCLDTGLECPGVFARSAAPLNDAHNNTALDHGFVKLYAGTLFRRQSDWLIVSAIGGGSWGMQAMCAPSAEGPYSHPNLVLWPQSGVFHPSPTEPYPAFESGGYVYAPFTGLASNREFQVMYRAPLGRATEASAWELVQSGSFLHWEGQSHGGVWGQTFSAFVDEAASGEMQLMYTAKDAQNVGSVNLAHRQWREPFSHGPWVSAPRHESLALMTKTLGDFELKLTVSLPIGGAWALRFNHRAPIGPGQAFPSAAMPIECTGSTILPWCTAAANNTALSFDGSGGWKLTQAGSHDVKTLTSGTAPSAAGTPLRIRLTQHNGHVKIDIDEAAAVSVAIPAAAIGGGLALQVAAGGALHVTEMVVQELEVAVEQRWVALLPSEAMANTASNMDKLFRPTTDRVFRSGAGFVHPGGATPWGYEGKQKMEVPMAKFNFIGVSARLWLPTGPNYGLISVSVDGGSARNISLYAPSNRSSSVVWQWREPVLSTRAADDGSEDDPQQMAHAHAVVIRWRAPPPPPPPQPESSARPGFEDTWVLAKGESCNWGSPASGTATVPYYGKVNSSAECQAKCVAARSSSTKCKAFSWCGSCGGIWTDRCYGRLDDEWTLHSVGGAVSGCDKSLAKCTLAPPPKPQRQHQGQLFPIDTLEYLPAFAAAQLQDTVTISNTVPWRCGGNSPDSSADCNIDSDSTGTIINSHDGNLVQDHLSGAFYLYGISFPDSCTLAEYDNCVSAGSCMAGSELKVTAYRSVDLVSWDLASGDLGVKLFGDQANVIYNARTGKYVAIYRGPISKLQGVPVAVADGPVGPFTQLPIISTANSGGDFVGSEAAWFVDTKGNAFVMYNSQGPAGTFYPAKQCLIELDATWTKSTGRKSCWVPPDGFGLEGGALWEEDGTYLWSAGSPCCNCEEGSDDRTYFTKDPMGNWTYLTSLNPPLQPRPPVPPESKRAPGSNPLPSGETCTLFGSWVGSVYLASGGQPLRAGLSINKLADGRFNFSESQPHNRRFVGIGTVVFAGGIANITLVEGVDKGAVGVADAWPGLPSGAGCTRIMWSGSSTTWGKVPHVHETKFAVSTQMFGMARITAPDGIVTHLYSGERYQTAPDGVFGHGSMYFQPLSYDAKGMPQPLRWVDNFTLPSPH